MCTTKMCVRLFVSMVLITARISATIDQQRKQALLDEVEARHSEDIRLLDAGEYGELVKHHTVDSLYMPNNGRDYSGREAIREELEKHIQAMLPVTTEGIQYSEVFSEDTAVVYHKMTSVDEFGKPWARYRLFATYKKIGGEWFVDRSIVNNRPLSDVK